MKGKRIVSLLLSGIMTVGLFAGCGSEKKVEKPQKKEETSIFNKTGFPIVKEKINLKMMGMNNPRTPKWEEMSFFKRMEELTNIHFDIEAIAPQSYEEKKNILVASGDIPDVFFKGALTKNNEINYSSQGIIVPLEELIKEYAPNITKIFSDKPSVKKSVTTPSARIVSLPYIDEQFVEPLNLNKKWMDKLGLKEPTTADELYNVFKAFKEKDPNGNGKQDEIPLTFETGGSDSLTFLKIFMSQFGVMFPYKRNVDADIYVNDNKKVVFSPIQPEFKEAIKFMNKLYSEGLMDKDTFTQTRQQVKAKGSAKDELLGSFMTMGPTIYVSEDRQYDYIFARPVKDAKGKQQWAGAQEALVQTGCGAITKNNKYPEATIRWFDYLYTQEGSRLLYNGIEGKDHITNADGSWEYTNPNKLDKMNLIDKVGPWLGATGAPYSAPFEYAAMEKQTIEASKFTTMQKKNVAPFVRTPFPNLYLTDEQQKQSISLSVDINTYVTQMMARFIVGDASVDKEWDAYVGKLQQMGYEKLLKIYQDAYDVYSKN